MQQDILQDIETAQSAPVINLPRLFIVHTLAALFLAFFGQEVSTFIFVLNWRFADDKMALLEYNYVILNFCIGVGLVTAYTFSYVFCRKYKVTRLIPFGITAFALLLYFFITHYLDLYWQRVLPGSYINVRVGFVAGSMTDIILFALIWIFLFFSKQSKQFIYQK